VWVRGVASAAPRIFFALNCSPLQINDLQRRARPRGVSAL
jgi:hypothetical protein